MARRAIWFGAALAWVSAIALLIVSGRHQQAVGPDLNSVLAFADPGHCRPGQPLATLLNSLMGFDERGEPAAGRPVAVRGFAEPLRPRMEREFGVGRDAIGSSTVYTLDLRGKWHGLSVVGLRTRTGTDSDLEIRFADDAGHVRDVLLRAGFSLAGVDEWRYPDYASPHAALELAPSMSIQSRRWGGASLICSS